MLTEDKHSFLFLIVFITQNIHISVRGKEEQEKKRSNEKNFLFAQLISSTAFNPSFFHFITFVLILNHFNDWIFFVQINKKENTPYISAMKRKKKK